MEGEDKSNVIKSSKQLCYILNLFAIKQDLKDVITEEVKTHSPETKYPKTTTKAIEDTLKFCRSWLEYKIPKYLSALDTIQRYVFTHNGITPGNYEYYCNQAKCYFMPPAFTVLEEYGIPYQITKKLFPDGAGNTVDEIIDTIKKENYSHIKLTSFEEDILSESLKNI